MGYISPSMTLLPCLFQLIPHGFKILEDIRPYKEHKKKTLSKNGLTEIKIYLKVFYLKFDIVKVYQNGNVCIYEKTILKVIVNI